MNLNLVPYFRPKVLTVEETSLTQGNFVFIPTGQYVKHRFGRQSSHKFYFKPSLTLHVQSFYHCILEWYGEHCTTVDEIVCWEGISYHSVCAYMFLSFSLSTLALKPFILVSYLPIGDDCKRTLKRKTRYTKIVPQRRYVASQRAMQSHFLMLRNHAIQNIDVSCY